MPEPNARPRRSNPMPSDPPAGVIAVEIREQAEIDTTLDDEIEVAWAEVRHAKGERDRYRAALEEVVRRTGQATGSRDDAAARAAAWNVARRALNEAAVS